MASQTKAEDDCFRWKCPFLACNDTFEFAWARGNHIGAAHPKKKQEKEETAAEPALPGAADVQQASSAETTDTASPSAPNKQKFTIPDDFTFEIEVPIRAAAFSEDKSVIEGNSSDGPDTPEESDTSSTQENSRRPPQKYALSIRGDFTVVLGTEEEGQVEVLVSSQVLCMSSRAWEKTCSNGCKETTQRRAIFNHDDADAMLLLLHVAHLKFAHVPTEMGRVDLEALAEVCDKYDNAMLLRPWMRGWIENHKKNWNESKTEGLLFVFWVFGDASGFERAAKRLVLLGTCKNGPGTLSMSSGVSFNGLFQVSQAIETMIEVRQKTIILLFDLCHSYLVELAQSKKCEMCGRTICHTLNLGYLLQGLSKIEVWPEKPLEVYLKSKTVLDLQQSLLKISFPETQPLLSDGYYSKSCIGILKRDFANRVTQICQSVTPILPHHHEKLTERNRRLKIFSDEIATK